MKTKKRVTGSTFFKIVVFVLLTASFLTGLLSATLTIFLVEGNAYNTKRTEWVEECVENVLWEEYRDMEYLDIEEYRTVYWVADSVYAGKNVIPLITVICVLMVIFCFIFLMCAAGHKNGESGLVPGVLAPIPLDIVTLGFGVVAILGIVLMDEAPWNNNLLTYSFRMLGLTLECIWLTIYCMELANRMKRGEWWKNSLIYMILRLIKKILSRIAWFFKVIITGIPLAVDFVLAFVAICIAEFIGLLCWANDADALLFWVLEKMILFPILLYVVIMCRRLQQGSESLADGDLNFKLDTKGMILDLKEHADNLNRARDGIEHAVEERMKSERMKTELITNVSHDIKTPLTSIINYADLLGNAVAMTGDVPDVVDRAQIEEYAEVLLRQSKRMKKLLDDLVEASKATTGNMEVHLVPCEIGVLLSQAVGEYEQRFEEKNLMLVVKQTDQTLRIAADGRHLWRVFDNLMNNICKYALENTRVYLTVESRDGYAEIAFRNISKYPLDISPEELEERFVRGDKSRHMEGSGLGLSIAKSLTGLQNGEMEIATDGDLFKVILRFALLEE